MKKIKLFGKSKSKKEEDNKDIDDKIEKVEDVEIPESIEESRVETVELPVKDYRETLYSRGHAPSKPPVPKKEKEKHWSSKRWENVEIIEKNVDNIGKKTLDHSKKTSTSPEISRKVDMLISKKKK